jgi:hypothetical protein
MPKAYLKHLKSSDDLKTTYEAIRAGFIELALEKNRRATPYVAEARALRAAASAVSSPSDLLKMEDIQVGLLSAAAVSEKAAAYLNEADRREAIAGLIQNFLEPAGAAWVEELVFRFLLTRGEALGGSMRNAIGSMGKRKLTRALLAQLHLAGRTCQWRDAAKQWSAVPEDNADIENLVGGLSWQSRKGPRTLLYNVNVAIVGKGSCNIDLCLYGCTPDSLPTVARNPECYVALGELKGGIDPKGADEHWKTARTALSRIREGFAKHERTPHTFYIGAAIATNMAAEIWSLLQSRVLENAANLTNDQQIASITQWLCNL